MDWSKIPNCLQSFNTPRGGTEQVAQINCIPGLLEVLINGALVFAGISTVFFIVIAGIKLINSGGDPKRLDSARKTLTYAILGLVIILGSFFIINFIANFTGAKCISTFGFNNCGG